ncbi:hypothetical protein Rhopal_000878-T1 [Rhodotorula paludigena]|uniref:Pre-rRNA-processing protein RIX1 n=1 Tax=Rhodotorula paludigena TaxID=86838 RepID=A0AAV5GH44_9BASI|nr:hypothetical protein Rhopal_000878-T1 [Rhodotorula paludigena]
MACATLDHLLAHQLAQNDLVPVHLPLALDALAQHRTLALAEHEEGANGPVLHRWQLRLTALVAASNAPPVRAAGFQLLHASFAASTSLLLAAAKPALAAAQQVLASPKSDPALFLAALELARLVLAKSTFHPEWARDNVGAQTVQKLVSGLVQTASAELSDVKLPCLAAIVSLIPLYPTALRPLLPALHTLAISLLADPSAGPSAVEAGASLFVSLYLLAPKGRDGLRDAWKTGIEALIGSIDALATETTSGIFAEDTTYNHLLSPLALPPLASADLHLALARLETLTRVLLLALRTPTTEKAGPVPVPLGALVELAQRLVSFSTAAPVRERVDPSLRTGVVAHAVPRLQLCGAQLAAQLARAAAPAALLAPHATPLLGALAGTLTTLAPRDPMRPALSAAYACVLEALGACVDPEEGKKSLARVWRSVLEDIGAAAMEPVVVRAAGANGKDGVEGAKGAGAGGRKAKRQKTYDPSESMAQRRIALDEVDVEIAERGLATLERLLRCPHAHFLPPALQLATSRLLLYLTLSPTFFVSHPVASTSASFYPATSALSPHSIASQSPTFRQHALRALVAALQTGTCAPSGFAPLAAEVARRAALSSDGTLRALALDALAHLRTVAHPPVPPELPNAALKRVRHERTGGWVGGEAEWETSAGEFRLQVEETREHGEDEDEEDEEEGMQVDGAAVAAAAAAKQQRADDDERRRKVAASLAAPAASSTSAAFPSTASFAAPQATPSTGFSAASNGFASFSAPAFGSTAPTSATPAAAQPSAADVVAPSSFSETVRVSSSAGSAAAPTLEVEVVTSAESKAAAVDKGKAKAVVDGGDEEDSDEDEGMPVIDMGSDEDA